MTTFNDAIKDETQITDEKIVEYGQKVKTWLEGELAQCASEHRQDFINAIKRINGIIAGEIEDDDIFGYSYRVVDNDKYLIEYNKPIIRLSIRLTPSLPDEILQLFKIGEYVNFQLFKDQLGKIPLIVNGENDALLIDTELHFYEIRQHDETHVAISLLEN